MIVEQDYIVAGGYYIEVGIPGELRVFGPNNHLYLGLIHVPSSRIELSDWRPTRSGYKLKVRARVRESSFDLQMPVMGDVRTLRKITSDFERETGSFIDLRRSPHIFHGEALPHHVEYDEDRYAVSFSRYYDEYFYRSTFVFDRTVSISPISSPVRCFRLEGKQGIDFELICETSDKDVYQPCSMLNSADELSLESFGTKSAQVNQIWNRSTKEVEHLISWGKTSGDRFGTIFPRDWMESAALGVGDIPAETIDYMLLKSLVHVDEEGKGWHEDVVGEYKYKMEITGQDLYDRKMIDIESWYMIALQWVTPQFWQNKTAIQTLKSVARYLINSAETEDLITFKKLPDTAEIPQWQARFTLPYGYHDVGDWRDSEWAYKRVHPIIAPFSVNAVFYPKALEVIREYSKELDVSANKVDPLIKKWSKVRDLYRIPKSKTNDFPGYSLALVGQEREQLSVHHLDEAYLYFLEPEKAEVANIVSFAERLMDNNYFYTSSGPVLVALNNTYGFTDAEYHGTVVWTKQVAFAVAGLTRILTIRKESLSTEQFLLIKEAAENTAIATIRAFTELNGTPELHVNIEDKASRWREGSGSSLQLWSAVGARRIIRDFEQLQTISQ